MYLRRAALAGAVLLAYACSFLAVLNRSTVPVPQVKLKNTTSINNIQYEWYPAHPASNSKGPSGKFEHGQNDTPADSKPDGLQYDPLRYLNSRKPPDNFILPRRYTTLLPVSRPDGGVWQDDAALALLQAWITMLAMIPRLLNLLANIPGSLEMHRRVQAAEAVHYRSYADMHDAAHSVLAGTADGTHVTLTVEATQSQLSWNPRRSYTYTFTHVQGYMSHGTQEDTGGNSGASEQQHNTGSASSSENVAGAQGQQSKAHLGGSGGTHSSGGGGDDEPHRSTAPGSTHQQADTGVRLSLAQIRGMANDAKLLALGVQYSSLHHLQQRTLAWHQARVCRITASEVPIITGETRYGVTWQELMDRKLQWDNDICFGRIPNFDQGFSEQALRRMAVGVQQEGPTVERYLQHMQQIWGTSYQMVAHEYGIFAHPSQPWLAASPDRVMVATDPTSGQQLTWLLEVKVCVDSALPQVLPAHVRQQALIQMACTQINMCDVVYATGDDLKVFNLVWDPVLDGEWNDLLQTLSWAYFQDLAPRLIQQRAQSGFVAASLLPQETTAPEGSTAALALARQALLEADIKFKGKAVIQGSFVMHASHPENGIGVVTRTYQNAGKDMCQVKFPNMKLGRKGFPLESVRRVLVGKQNQKQPDMSTLGQVVQCLGGNHAGRLGITIKFTGAKWKVEFSDGSTTSVNLDNLHVLDTADEKENTAWESGHTVISMPGRNLYSDLQVDLQSFPDWRDEYQAAEGVELVIIDNRKRVCASQPLTLRRALSDATNAENTGGQHSTPGFAGASTTTGASASVAATMAPSTCHTSTTGDGDEYADDTTVLTAVTSVGVEWTIRFGCRRGHGRKGRDVSKMKNCDCKFDMVVKHPVGASYVLITERCWHTNHDVKCPLQANYLKPTEAGVQQVWAMLECGTKPKRICDVLNRQMNQALAQGTVQKYIASFNNPRMRWTVGMIEAQKKAMSRQLVADYLPDTAQVELLVTQTFKEFVVWYQPYKPAVEQGNPEQPFVLVLAHKFQLSMLNQFGRRLVHLDGTGGTNRNGFLLATMLVVDEFNNGVPVGMMITSCENAEVHTHFMRKMADATREQAPNGADFEYKHVMIDKSPTEVSAIRECCGSEKHLFCYFHFLQEWERFARSAKGGMKEAVQRADLLTDLSTLVQIVNEVVFRETEKRFCNKWQHFPEVVENYKANWAGCAKHWAHFGRADILDLCRDTNNHLERFQGIFKYDFLDRNTKNSVPTLIQKICIEMVPRYVNDRAEKLGRGKVSVAVAAQAKREQRAAELVASNALNVQDGGIGLVQVAAKTGSTQLGYFTVCLAELSCTCPDHLRFKTACKHIQALQLSELVPEYTHGMRLEAADRINAGKALVPVDGATAATVKLYQCPALQQINKAVAHGAFTISMHESYCSCLGFKLHGGCCHLIAASRMPEGDGVVSTVAWHGMDAQQQLAVIPTPITGHPAVEPLTDAVYQYMCTVHQVVPQSVLEHNAAASTPMAQIAQSWQTIQRTVKVLPLQQQEVIMKKMQALAAECSAAAADAGLPHTNKQLSADVTRYWNRQAHHIKTRALLKARTRNSLKHFSVTHKATLGKRADTLIAGLQKDVLAAGGASCGVLNRLPTRQEAGAPRHFVGIAAGRFGKRGGNAHGKKVPKQLRGASSMAASAGVGGEGVKSRRKQQRSKQQKSKDLS